MLTNLTLENFKAFQKLDDLKIKPITILCGTNSCGKSSILQSILLLKQTLESNNPNQNLLINGTYVKLGYFDDIVFKKDLSNKVSFEISFKVDRNQPVNRFFEKKALSNKFKFSELLSKSGEYLFNFKITLSAHEDNKSRSPNFLRTSLIEEIIFNVSEVLPDGLGLPLSISAKFISSNTDKYDNRGNTYVLEYLEGEKSLFKNDVWATNFSNLFPSSFKYDPYPKDQSAGENFFDSFKEIKVFLEALFTSFSYIGPLRSEPERRYIYEDEVLEIGNKGENAAYLYHIEKNEIIPYHFFYNTNKDCFEESSGLTLHSALRKWFDLMKIPKFKAKINNKIIYLDMEASAYDETRVGIADVGFGVSQIFPIILEGLRMEKGATLMLEQPEIHLHPNLQMQMADYFISLALSGKSVLVETHSDHVINRLVRRIVEDETHNLQDLIGIYFIKPSENGSVYEEVKIDETKGIVNWPPDFFDQTANEQMKIMQAGLKKRKNQRIPANGNAS